MRSSVVLALIACGDKPPADPVTPTAGSTPVGVVPDAAQVVSRIGVRASGKPPLKTTRAFSRDQLAKLAALELPGLVKTVRKLDEAFLDLGYQLLDPPIRIQLTAQPCLRCLPMRLDRWQAETDALKLTIPPDLRDRAETELEIEQIAIGGSPAIATHQVAFTPGDPPVYDHAVSVYWNDSVNELRVTAAFAGTVSSRDALTTAVTRAELEQVAVAVLDRHAQSL